MPAIVATDFRLEATKVFGDTMPGPNGRGASRAHILDGVKASLARLQLDHIDLYQIHGFDVATPIEETLRALDQLAIPLGVVAALISGEPVGAVVDELV